LGDALVGVAAEDVDDLFDGGEVKGKGYALAGDEEIDGLAESAL
jgi:hypothetical protein